jgi:hypothetical protein
VSRKPGAVHADFAGLDTADTTRFLDGLEAGVDAGAIAPYEPGHIELASAIAAIVAT